MQKPRQTVSHLWREFVLELRYRWERAIPLPGYDGSNPGFADCLLHQKLQMLNCCILHKLKRQKHHAKGELVSSASSASSKTDEYFDCYEDTTEIDSAVSTKPEGRLRPLAPDVFMAEKSDELLYIPTTQDPAPVTEDTLEEYGRMLTNMGTSAESTFARAKMPTDTVTVIGYGSLQANPHYTMEDFIRWYSPRDWIEELDRETGRLAGRLSEWMSAPGNLWREVWDNARPIPVARQKRLFDDTTEAEKILHWLYGMQISELIRLLAPPLFSCALLQLDEEAGAVKKLVSEKLEMVASQYSQATLRNLSLEYEDLRPQMTEIERTISQCRSLGRLSSHVVPSEENEGTDLEIQTFALDLLTDKDVKILGASRGTFGMLISNMFSKDDRLRFETRSENAIRFPPFYSKEYILRSIHTSFSARCGSTNRDLIRFPPFTRRNISGDCTSTSSFVVAMLRRVRVTVNEFRSAGALQIAHCAFRSAFCLRNGLSVIIVIGTGV